MREIGMCFMYKNYDMLRVNGPLSKEKSVCFLKKKRIALTDSF